MPSHLEEAFANQWLVCFPGLPFHREFTLPVWDTWALYQKQEGLRSRKPAAFRADFAWPDAQVAVEVNGGIWRPGGHSTGQGISRDITKTMLAQLSGWVLIPLSEAHIFDGTPYWLSLIADLIESRRSQRVVATAGGATRWCGPGPKPSHPHAVADPLAVGSKQHVPTSRRKRRAERDRVDLRQELKSLRSGPGAATDL